MWSRTFSSTLESLFRYSYSALSQVDLFTITNIRAKGMPASGAICNPIPAKGLKRMHGCTHAPKQVSVIDGAAMDTLPELNKRKEFRPCEAACRYEDLDTCLAADRNHPPWHQNAGSWEGRHP